MKDKPNSTRIYDKDGFRQRAACICVKNEEESEILLVSSSRNLNQWIVPGGGVEPDEDSPNAAIREVIEEAGVKGNLGRCIGIFENSERKHRTAVYILVVNEEMEEWEDSQNIGRRRRWFSREAAAEELAISPLQLNYLKHLKPNTKEKSQETENGAEAL